MVGCKFYIKAKAKRRDWIKSLLEIKFFSSCVEEHEEEVRKNEINMYCIDCNRGFCRHCIRLHCLHQSLQICKYVYHDVVRLQHIQKHLDCSKIQTYKINGEKAVHLNPRPRSKDAKPSTKAKCAGSCVVCGRYLQDQPNSFCSIACKVSSAASTKSNEQISHKYINTHAQNRDMPFEENYNSETNTSEVESSTLSMAESTEEVDRNPALKPRKLLHKRKGTPQRAPLY